jgi:hypothetical protein
MYEAPESELMPWTAEQGSMAEAADAYAQQHPTRWVTMVETVDDKTVRVHSVAWPGAEPTESA